ncbi:MAG: hypothetical protein HY934_05455 [Candidatus Firestonebacteria bacterium]|nr:hypothetical protein [Candidatus Firestonebacteria bacterium]
MAEKIYINTTGIGRVIKNRKTSASYIKHGDAVILTGSIGDHGMAIMNARVNLGFYGNLKSDCTPLNHMLRACVEKCRGIHAMRDPTRGGLATTLNELADSSGTGILIHEDLIHINKAVESSCNIIGIDPLYVACEGKAVIITDKKEAQKAVKILRQFKVGRKTGIIGEVISKKGVYLKTETGGIRPLFMLEGDMLPRIC